MYICTYLLENKQIKRKTFVMMKNYFIYLFILGKLEKIHKKNKERIIYCIN